MIFSDRTQSDVIGGKWYLLSSRETRLTKQIWICRSSVFEKTRKISIESPFHDFSTHGRDWIEEISIWITRFIYGINIHRRNWIRGANGNSRIGELITGNEEQTELSLAVLRRLIVFVRLRETEPEVSRGRFTWSTTLSPGVALKTWPTINRRLILFSRCWRNGTRGRKKSRKPLEPRELFEIAQNLENEIFPEIKFVSISRSVSDRLRLG